MNEVEERELCPFCRIPVKVLPDNKITCRSEDCIGGRLTAYSQVDEWLDCEAIPQE